MTLAQLSICAGCIYTFFLAWGLLQERLTTTPYYSDPSLIAAAVGAKHGDAEYFRSPLMLNWLQAMASATLAAVYLLLRKPSKSNASLTQTLGLGVLTPSGSASALKLKSDSKVAASLPRVSPLLVRYLSIAAFQSVASSLGLLSLAHGISYPTLTLAKSCKLLPVLLFNVLVYRAPIKPYKYAVVGLVTAGISAFMLAAPSKAGKSKGAGSDSLVGLLLLAANLALDGATNSTQDNVFSKWSISGPQMMLVMNALASLLMGASLVLPLPTFLGGAPGAANELNNALGFIQRHRNVVKDLAGYALAGAAGQVAIFETLERFGSLTLVSITVSVAECNVCFAHRN